MQRENTKILPLLTIIGVLTLVIASLSFWKSGLFWFGMSPDETEQVMSEAKSRIAKGDFSAAVSEAEEVLAGSSYQTISASTIVDSGKFMTGDAQKRIEAIRLTKETYMQNNGKPLTQALQINKLLGYINSGYETYVFDEIFSGEPFQNLLVKGDMGSSIRNLAEHSVALYPTTAALFRMGQWHTDRIRDLYGTWNASPEEKKIHADEILKIIDAADALIEREVKEAKGNVFDYMVMPRYLFWKTYLYGGAARVYPQYLEDSRKNLDALVNVYETTLDEQGNKIPLIATRLPYGYFDYVWALYDVEGEKAVPEVTRLLDKQVDLIKENPDLHMGSYIALIARAAKLSEEQRERYYKGHIELAKVHARYKKMLELAGWKFSE